MRRFRFGIGYAFLAAAFALPVGAPASAEVTRLSEQGFAVLHVVKINAPPEKVWATLIAPQSYWSNAHSWSGSAANMYLDPQAGGCFCEKIPAKSGEGGSLNSVEHMRVIYSERPRVLRMSGALGPLQSEGVSGTLNIALEADGTGTKISMSYVVGGFMRMKVADMAPAVDAVIGEQLLRLKARAEGRDPAGVAWPPKKGDAAKASADPDLSTAKPETTPAPPKDAIPAPKPLAPKPLADKPKDTPPPAKAQPAKATPIKPAAPNAAPPKAATVEPKPSLAERLKDADAPGAAPAPIVTPTAPNTPPKKKPIVEEAPKKKPAAVPPGTR